MAMGDSFSSGPSETCPHGVPIRIKCDLCEKEQAELVEKQKRQEFAKERLEIEKREGRMLELVNQLVFGQPEPNPEKMLQMISAYRATLPQNATERELAILDYMEGTAHHTKTNDLLNRFDAFVRKTAPGKNLTDMTRQEYYDLFVRWADRDSYEAAEKAAIDSYKKADRSWIVSIGRTGMNKLETGNAALQKMDLEWRAAQRILDKSERDQALDLILKRVEVMVANMSEAGKSAEYKLILMIRNLAQRKDLDHAISIEHTLPRQDLHDQQQHDLVLRIAPFSFDIQQKTYTVSANDPVYNAKQEANLKDKVEARSMTAAGAILDTYHVRDAYEEYLSGGIRDQRKLIKSLNENLPSNVQEAIEKLLAPDPKKERVRANEADMQKFIDVPKLIQLGYLPGPTNDTKVLMTAKKEALEKLKSLKPNRDDLVEPTPEFVEKLRKAA